MRRVSRGYVWLAVAAILATALSLRAPMIGVTPVLRQIEVDLMVSSTVVSLLTTVPVLLFALMTPAAAVIIRRAGPEIALLLCSIVIVLGMGLRLLPGFEWMIGGTVVVGLGIAVGNVVVPVLIRRDVPERFVATITALYAAVMNFGSLVVTLTTVPLAHELGWPLAVFSWAWITLLAVVLGALYVWRRRVMMRDEVAPVETAAEVEILTGSVPTLSSETLGTGRPRRVIWLLAAAFCAQTSGFYALSTWLPTMLSDTLSVDAVGAGAIASIFQGVGVVGALVVPVLALRMPVAVPAAVVSVCWLAVSTGLLLAPQWYVLWITLGGIGHGGGFVVVMTVLVRVCRSDLQTAAASATVQGFGYLLGAAGGPVIGAIHDGTQSWNAALCTTLGFAIAFSVLLTLAVRSARSV